MRTIGRRLSEAKSVRAFAFEVLIVVVGVLIALGAQQLVEEWNWRQKVAAGEQRLKDEANDTEFVFVEQAIVAPCVVAQLDLLDAKLRQPGEWSGTESYPSSRGNSVIRAPTRTLPLTLWDTLGNEGTALHFEADRALATASYYDQLRELADLFARVEVTRSELDYLAEPADLSLDARARAREKIGAIRYDTNLAGLTSAQLLANLSESGRMSPPDVLDRQMESIKAIPYSTLKICADRDLPLGDWKQAVRLEIAKLREDGRERRQRRK